MSRAKPTAPRRLAALAYGHRADESRWPVDAHDDGNTHHTRVSSGTAGSILTQGYCRKPASAPANGWTYFPW